MRAVGPGLARKNTAKSKPEGVRIVCKLGTVKHPPTSHLGTPKMRYQMRKGHTVLGCVHFSYSVNWIGYDRIG